jgi:hypothetical protein
VLTQPLLAEFISGNEELSTLNGLPFITLQAAFSYMYTELKLRYIGIPSIEGNGFHFPGIGLQHDFHHFFPTLPISLSLAANFTLLSVTITPGGDIEGDVKATGLSHFIGILTGYNVAKFFEVFLEAGWDHSFVKGSGSLTAIEDGQPKTAIIDKKISGRNGFRIALNLAFPIHYHPVIGGIGGAQFGSLLNIISFRSKKKE